MFDSNADPQPAPSTTAWAEQLSSSDLEGALRSTAAEIAAGTYRFLVLIAEFDRRDAHEPWECRSAADWLSWHCGLGPAAAREHVRVARRLTELPLIAAEFERGGISYSKVRALTRVAEASSEQDLLHLAASSTAGQLERMCSALRRHGAAPDDQDELRENELRAEDLAHVTWSRLSTGELVGTFRLPPEAGDALTNALRAAEEGSDTDESGLRRRARALETLATSFLAAPNSAERSQPEVMVHVDLVAVGQLAGILPGLAASSASPAGAGAHRPRALARTSMGTHLSASALTRLVGDAGLRYVADLADGTQLDLGRHQRTVTPKLFRAIKARDSHCRFPGCSSTQQLHAHHIQWWSHGGATSPENLILLCRKHHHAVHDRRWTCTGTASAVEFRTPQGRAVTNSSHVPHVSAETLLSSNRRFAEHPADTAGGQWVGDQIDWECLFAAFEQHLPLPPHLLAA